MKTWLDLDVLLIPAAFFVLLLFPMCLPTVELNGHFYGGGIIKEWILNQIFMPLIPFEQNTRVLDWWYQANWVEECLVYLIFSVNIYALLLPFIYAVMKSRIVVSNWYHLRQFGDKQSHVKRQKGSK